MATKRASLTDKCPDGVCDTTPPKDARPSPFNKCERCGRTYNATELYHRVKEQGTGIQWTLEWPWYYCSKQCYEASRSNW